MLTAYIHKVILANGSRVSSAVPKVCHIVIQCVFSVYFDTFPAFAYLGELLTIHELEDPKRCLHPHFQAHYLLDSYRVWSLDTSNRYLSKSINNSAPVCDCLQTHYYLPLADHCKNEEMSPMFCFELYFSIQNNSLQFISFHFLLHKLICFSNVIVTGISLYSPLVSRTLYVFQENVVCGQNIEVTTFFPILN